MCQCGARGQYRGPSSHPPAPARQWDGDGEAKNNSLKFIKKIIHCHEGEERLHCQAGVPGQGAAQAQHLLEQEGELSS